VMEQRGERVKERHLSTEKTGLEPVFLLLSPTGGGENCGADSRYVSVCVKGVTITSRQAPRSAPKARNRTALRCFQNAVASFTFSEQAKFGSAKDGRQPE
jgi:hypothetical protein